MTELPTADIPGQWQTWDVLPDALECDQCDELFGVGADVWVVRADMPPGAVSHLCRTCAERSIFKIQQQQPLALPSVAAKMSLRLYRPERELTLDEVVMLEVATKLLQDEGGRLIARRPNLH